MEASKLSLQAMSRLFLVQVVLTHFNPFHCSICGKPGWLVFTSGVRRGRLWSEFLGKNGV